jgi:hypothetical protein
MSWNRMLLVLTILAALASPAPAGWLFGRKTPKPDPNERIKELLTTVKSDGDEGHREDAAEELRHFDAGSNPDIIPTLVDVLAHDSKPAVRAEAAATLGRLRPISQQAGWALEQALARDPSMRVRLQARSSLMHYYMAGYHGGKNPDAPPTDQAQSPPAVDTNQQGTTNTAKQPTTNTTPSTGQPASVVSSGPPRLRPTPVETPPPPLAPPLPAAKAGASVPQPLSKGPPPSGSGINPLQIPTPPLPSASPDDRKEDPGQGPELTPPPTGPSPF